MASVSVRISTSISYWRAI